MQRIVDLRSDTLTRPGPEMREVMAAAPVGDDVFGEDPTICSLQERMAELTGKESALFVTSGTQGNQVSINAHTRPGHEVIVDRNSHIVNYESGAPAMLAGVQLHILDGTNGIISREQISEAIRPTDDHYPQTGLICLENTHNRAGGKIFPIDDIAQIAGFAREANLPLHLDGARLWNAAVATGISIKEYCSYFDSVSLCFSKGLGAPVGSVVVGSADFIKRAHFYRKAYGGGIRQGGILAAAALYALDNHLDLLHDDHRRALEFAKAIDQLPHISVDFDTVETNLVIFELDPAFMPAKEFTEQLSELGILMFPFGGSRIRAVTHLEITDGDIEYAVSQFRGLLNG